MANNALTPTFVFSYEKRMRAVQVDEHARMLTDYNTWWPAVAKEHKLDGASDRLTYFLDTADLRPVGKGGNIPFELVTMSTETVPQRYPGSWRRSAPRRQSAC